MSSAEPPARVIDSWLSFPDARHRIVRWERDTDAITVLTACGRWLPIGGPADVGPPSEQPCGRCDP